MAGTPSEVRPDIRLISTGEQLKRWYWLKDELIAQARTVGVKTSGGKFVILERLAHFLDTGQKVWPGDQKQQITSKFDWHRDALTLQTPISDSYKNSQNVRRFFKAQVGDSFKFNLALMDWMKTNIGKTLGDAVAQYHVLHNQACEAGYKTDIKAHNQFNQYTRDILADNPALGMDDVRRIWALKRALPMSDGRHIYERSDLELSKP